MHTFGVVSKHIHSWGILNSQQVVDVQYEWILPRGTLNITGSKYESTWPITRCHV